MVVDVPWEAILSSITFQLALVTEVAPLSSPDEDVAAPNFPNEGQHGQHGRIARELKTLSSQFRVSVSLQWMARLVQALGRQQACCAGWRRSALTVAILAAREVCEPLIRIVHLPAQALRKKAASLEVILRILQHHESVEKIVVAGMRSMGSIIPCVSLPDSLSGARRSQIVEWLVNDLNLLRNIGKEPTSGSLVDNVTIAALRNWPNNRAVQQAGLHMLRAIARNAHGREDLIKLGAIALAFRALDSFRADADVQKAAHNALDQLVETRDICPGGGYRESRVILSWLAAIKAHPWWDEWHLDPRAAGAIGATCSACSSALAWCRQSAKLEAWRCATCRAANTGPGAAPAHEVLLCPSCHASFQSGSYGVHVAGHLFEKEGHVQCRQATSRHDPGAEPHHPHGYDPGAEPHGCKGIADNLVWFSEGYMRLMTCHILDGASPKFGELMIKLSMQCLHYYGKSDIEVLRSSVYLLSSLVFGGFLFGVPRRKDDRLHYLMSAFCRLLIEEKVLSALLAATRELPGVDEAESRRGAARTHETSPANGQEPFDPDPAAALRSGAGEAAGGSSGRRRSERLLAAAEPPAHEGQDAPPFYDDHLIEKLGLAPEEIEDWRVARDLHSDYSSEEEEEGQGATVDDKTKTEKHNVLAELRFIFFELAPPGCYIKELLRALQRDLSSISELEALVSLAESARSAGASDKAHRALARRTFKVLARGWPAATREAIKTGSVDRYLDSVTAIFRSADTESRRLDLVFSDLITSDYGYELVRGGQAAPARVAGGAEGGGSERSGGLSAQRAVFRTLEEVMGAVESWVERLELQTCDDAGAAARGGGGGAQAARRAERAGGSVAGSSVRLEKGQDGQLMAARRMLARLKEYQISQAGGEHPCRDGRHRGRKVLSIGELVLARTGLK